MCIRRRFMEALDKFIQVSGLVPSLSKSTAYFCNVLNYVKLVILHGLNRITGWKNKSLFATDRLQLVQSVLALMHVYWALVFILPTRIIGIEQLIRSFLWSQGDTSRAGFDLSSVVKYVLINGSWTWSVEWVQFNPKVLLFSWRIPRHAFNDGKVTLVDDEGKPLEKVVSSGDRDSEDEVASVDNEMASFFASKKLWNYLKIYAGLPTVAASLDS
ncbi:hypothetical protein Tco_0680934 [Tanacetum coccineum]|uniref:Reverse transcriptase zinc-binding domain-containing protein n=1 Tax=Tanacetum coccineum TaxID=301880 RepID=A0ABQ4XNH2_9ASTR